MVGAGIWQDYLDNFAAMAGTLFALVLAARGLLIGIGGAGARREEGGRWYQVLDGISSTYELAAAALLALFAGAPVRAFRFITALPLFVAALGVVLIVATWVCLFAAWRKFTKAWSRVEGVFQSALCLLPAACYLACFRVWFPDLFGTWQWPRAWIAPESAVALAVSWLTVSGTVQAIWWNAITWHAQLSQKPAASSSTTAPS